jgi:hypothetical protein
LNLVSATAPAAADHLSDLPVRGGAREHVVLGSYPTLTGVVKVGGLTFLDGSIAKYSRSTRRNQHGSFRVDDVFGFYLNLSQVVTFAAVGAHHWINS